MLLVLLSAVKNSTQHRNYLISNFDLTELCIRFVVQKHECVLQMFGKCLTRYCLIAMEILEQICQVAPNAAIIDLCMRLLEYDGFTPLLSPALRLLDSITQQQAMIPQLENEFNVVKRISDSLFTSQEKFDRAKQYGIGDDPIINNYIQLVWKLKILEKMLSSHTGTVLAQREQITIVDRGTLKVWCDIIDITKDELYGRAKPDESKVEAIELFSRLIWSCKQRVQSKLAPLSFGKTPQQHSKFGEVKGLAESLDSIGNQL